MLKFAICFMPTDLSEALEIAVRADKLGLHAICPADSQFLCHELFSCLAACALKTERVLLGPTVTNPVTRHPTVVASAMMTLSELSNGRAFLGIGRGDSAVFMAGLKPSPVSKFEEYIIMLKSLMRGEAVEFNGKKVNLLRSCDVPIYVAATGPRMLQLAGRVADGAIMAVGTEEAAVKYALSHVEKGAQEAGRDPNEIRTIAWIPCAISSNREKAKRDVSGVVGSMIHFATGFSPTERGSHMASEVPEIGLSDDMVNALRAKYDYSQHGTAGAAHSGHFSEQLIDKFALAGTVDDCIRGPKRIESLGVNQVTLVLKGDRLELIEKIAQDIVPEFR